MARWTIKGLQDGVDYAMHGIRLVLQNPNLRTHKYLRIVLYLSALSFIIYLVSNVLVGIVLFIAQIAIWLTSSKDEIHMAELITTTRQNIRDVIVMVPLVGLMLMRYVYPKPLDDLFMESLRYIDSQHPDRAPYAPAFQKRNYRKEIWPQMKGYMKRMWKNLRLGLVIYALSFMPIVGPYVFPAAAAYATYRSLGNTQAVVVGICFLFLPQGATKTLVRALIGMRTLMRELLEPYFARMGMSHKEKLRWFSGRKDVLFGFSAIAYILVRIPFVGVIGYGISQAAAAYMLTAVIDPPPAEDAKQSEQQQHIDQLNISEKKAN
ncbi:uncharacterized protein BYT42DRAFT_591371 [Radiomyces spectabilis]|uniref:uncharacterized protein n=1 Tax=Radiomyces spectabilis TaxID=64574 RepID=UPI00221E8866|nr:uncharacterized protein BYT42DRAFT_591371 [Radiomyces spectabilis]KAI8393740.1 hypothetical protein BYT42DRAFT_591371 [Radiomyces spectabilis]